MPNLTTRNGYTFFVDEEDLDKFDLQKCFGRVMGRTSYIGVSGTESKMLHSLLLKVPPGFTVDHKDGNALNNRRDNLRQATYTQNQGNRRLSRDNTTGYKGVSIDKRKRFKKYRAWIGINQKRKPLGNFYTPTEAAKAYNEAAIQYFGIEFAKLNEI